MGLERDNRITLIHEYYRALIENSLDLIILLDTAAVIKFISPSVEKVLGYTSREVVGTCIFEYIQFDEVKKARIIFDRLVSNPFAKEYFECHAEHKDGTWIDIEAIGESFLEHPCINGIVVNARDITNRKAAEKELRINQDRFGIILDLLPEIISIIDAAGNIQYVGEPIHKMLGYEPREVGSHNIFDMIHPDDLERVIPIVLSISEGPGARIDTTCRVKHKDGRWRHIEVVSVNYTDEPAIGGNLSIIRDVSDRVVVEDIFEEAMRGLVEESSYEILQVATILKGYSSLLRDHGERFDQKEQQIILDTIESGANKLTSLASKLAHLSIRGPSA